MRSKSVALGKTGLLICSGLTIAMAPHEALSAGATAPPPPPAFAQRWDGVWAVKGGALDQTPRTPMHVKPDDPLPELAPAYEAKFKSNLAAMERGDPTVDKTTLCFPAGMPRFMDVVYTLEILVTPGEVTLIGEYDSQVRHIYTDGRKAPAEPDPSYNGYSTGHWEGETLVVETVGLRPDTMFGKTRPGPSVVDLKALPHSTHLKLYERMRLLNPSTWEDVVTVTDPEVFAKPWSFTKVLARQPGMEQREDVCEENNIHPYS